MIDPARLSLIRLEAESALESEIESKHARTIRKMVREVEDYFLEMDYEEMVRDEDSEEEETARYERQVALAQGIVVTRKTSAHLYDLVDRAMRNIGLSSPSDLTVNIKRVFDRAGEDLFNAFCVHAGDAIFISFTPMLLNVLTDDEILDVIGHELGHAASKIPRYLEDYFYFAWGRWEDGLIDVDPDISNEDLDRLAADVREILDAHFDHETDAKIVRLMRLKEMTSDRFGLLASRSLASSCTSLMRQETLGLDPRFFDYDHIHLIHQLDELGQMRKDPATRWLFDATHPVLPARIAALEIFDRSQRYFQLLNGDITPPLDSLDAASERSSLETILRKSELIPEGEDLAEVQLVACLFHRIAKRRREPNIVRRLVWEFYRDFFASIPTAAFDIEFRKSSSLIKDLGRKVSQKPIKDRKGLIRDIVAFVKDQHLLTRDARDDIVSAALSIGLTRSVPVTYLKRVGAWRRFTRGS